MRHDVRASWPARTNSTLGVIIVDRNSRESEACLLHHAPGDIRVEVLPLDVSTWKAYGRLVEDQEVGEERNEEEKQAWSRALLYYSTGVEALITRPTETRPDQGPVKMISSLV